MNRETPLSAAVWKEEDPWGGKSVPSIGDARCSSLSIGSFDVVDSAAAVAVVVRVVLGSVLARVGCESASSTGADVANNKIWGGLRQLKRVRSGVLRIMVGHLLRLSACPIVITAGIIVMLR